MRFYSVSETPLGHRFVIHQMTYLPDHGVFLLFILLLLLIAFFVKMISNRSVGIKHVQKPNPRIKKRNGNSSSHDNTYGHQELNDCLSGDSSDDDISSSESKIDEPIVKKDSTDRKDDALQRLSFLLDTSKEDGKDFGVILKNSSIIKRKRSQTFPVFSQTYNTNTFKQKSMYSNDVPKTKEASKYCNTDFTVMYCLTDVNNGLPLKHMRKRPRLQIESRQTGDAQDAENSVELSTHSTTKRRCIRRKAIEPTQRGPVTDILSMAKTSSESCSSTSLFKLSSESITANESSLKYGRSQVQNWNPSPRKVIVYNCKHTGSKRRKLYYPSIKKESNRLNNKDERLETEAKRDSISPLFTTVSSSNSTNKWLAERLPAEIEYSLNQEDSNSPQTMRKTQSENVLKNHGSNRLYQTWMVNQRSNSPRSRKRRYGKVVKIFSPEMIRTTVNKLEKIVKSESYSTLSSQTVRTKSTCSSTGEGPKTATPKNTVKCPGEYELAFSNHNVGTGDPIEIESDTEFCSLPQGETSMPKTEDQRGEKCGANTDLKVMTSFTSFMRMESVIDNEYGKTELKYLPDMPTDDSVVVEGEALVDYLNTDKSFDEIVQSIPDAYFEKNISSECYKIIAMLQHESSEESVASRSHKLESFDPQTRESFEKYVLCQSNRYESSGANITSKLHICRSALDSDSCRPHSSKEYRVCQPREFESSKKSVANLRHLLDSSEENVNIQLPRFRSNEEHIVRKRFLTDNNRTSDKTEIGTEKTCIIEKVKEDTLLFKLNNVKKDVCEEVGRYDMFKREESNQNLKEIFVNKGYKDVIISEQDGKNQSNIFLKTDQENKHKPYKNHNKSNEKSHQQQKLDLFFRNLKKSKAIRHPIKSSFASSIFQKITACHQCVEDTDLSAKFTKDGTQSSLKNDEQIVPDINNKGNKSNCKRSHASEKETNTLRSPTINRNDFGHINKFNEEVTQLHNQSFGACVSNRTHKSNIFGRNETKYCNNIPVYRCETFLNTVHGPKLLTSNDQKEKNMQEIKCFDKNETVNEIIEQPCIISTLHFNTDSIDIDLYKDNNGLSDTAKELLFPSQTSNESVSYMVTVDETVYSDESNTGVSSEETCYSPSPDHGCENVINTDYNHKLSNSNVQEKTNMQVITADKRFRKQSEMCIAKNKITEVPFIIPTLHIDTDSSDTDDRLSDISEESSFPSQTKELTGMVAVSETVCLDECSSLVRDEEYNYDNKPDDVIIDQMRFEDAINTANNYKLSSSNVKEGEENQGITRDERFRKRSSTCLAKNEIIEESCSIPTKYINTNNLDGLSDITEESSFHSDTKEVTAPDLVTDEKHINTNSLDGLSDITEESSFPSETKEVTASDLVTDEELVYPYEPIKENEESMTDEGKSIMVSNINHNDYSTGQNRNTSYGNADKTHNELLDRPIPDVLVCPHKLLEQLKYKILCVTKKCNEQFEKYYYKEKETADKELNDSEDTPNETKKDVYSRHNDLTNTEAMDNSVVAISPDYSFVDKNPADSTERHLNVCINEEVRGDENKEYFIENKDWCYVSLKMKSSGDIHLKEKIEDGDNSIDKNESNLQFKFNKECENCYHDNDDYDNYSDDDDDDEDEFEDVEELNNVDENFDSDLNEDLFEMSYEGSKDNICCTESEKLEEICTKIVEKSVSLLKKNCTNRRACKIIEKYVSKYLYLSAYEHANKGKIKDYIDDNNERYKALFFPTRSPTGKLFETRKSDWLLPEVIYLKSRRIYPYLENDKRQESNTKKKTTFREFLERYNFVIDSTRSMQSYRRSSFAILPPFLEQEHIFEL